MLLLHMAATPSQAESVHLPMIRSSLVSLQGTAIAQAITLAFLPIMTRLYSPDEFAVFQLFSLILGVGLVLTAFRYEQALLVAETDVEVAHLFAACLLGHLLTSLFAALALFLCVLGLNVDWRIDLVVLSWLPVAALAGGLLQTLTQILLRHGRFGGNAAAKVLQASAFVLGASFAASAGFGSAGLVIGDTIARGSAAALAILVLGRSSIFRTNLLDPRGLVPILRKYRDFPTMMVPSGLLSSLNGLVVPAAMLSLFGATTFGHYAMAERLLLAPVAMVSLAIGQAFAAQLSVLVIGRKDCSTLFARTAIAMSGIGVTLAAAVFFIGPALLPSVLGPEWAESGEFLRPISVMLCVSIVAGPLNSVPALVGWSRFNLVWEAARLAGTVGIWFGALKIGLDPLAAAWLHALFYLGAHAGFVGLCWYAVQRVSPR